MRRDAQLTVEQCASMNGHGLFGRSPKNQQHGQQADIQICYIGQSGRRLQSVSTLQVEQMHGSDQAPASVSVLPFVVSQCAHQHGLVSLGPDLHLDFCPAASDVVVLRRI